MKLWILTGNHEKWINYLNCPFIKKKKQRIAENTSKNLKNTIMITFLINYLCLNLAETTPINFWKLIVRKCFTHNLWVSSNRKLLFGDDLTSQFITCSFDKGQPHLTTSPSRQKTQIYYQLKKKKQNKNHNHHAWYGSTGRKVCHTITVMHHTA